VFGVAGCQVRTYNLKTTKNMRELNPTDIDQMVSIRGMVTRTTGVQPDLQVRGPEAITMNTWCETHARAHNNEGEAPGGTRRTPEAPEDSRRTVTPCRRHRHTLSARNPLEKIGILMWRRELSSRPAARRTS
jgi:DNA replicative helicase MCM subunit Mcm2 (Cdc46/Mcm family)